MADMIWKLLGGFHTVGILLGIELGSLVGRIVGLLDGIKLGERVDLAYNITWHNTRLTTGKS